MSFPQASRGFTSLFHKASHQPSSLRRYTKVGSNSQGVQERAPSTEKEFKRVAEEKMKAAAEKSDQSTSTGGGDDSIKKNFEGGRDDKK